MTPSARESGNRRTPAGPAPNVWLHRYAVFVAGCTALLVFAGGLVTSTGAGLSVPDWPLSYGMLFPPLVGNVRFEHGHRMVATAVGMLTIVLAIWLHRRDSRTQVRRLGWVALGAVVLQGLLGGLTVLLLLPTPVSVAHATLGQTFFCVVVTIALVTSPGWRESAPGAGSPVSSGPSSIARWAAPGRRPSGSGPNGQVQLRRLALFLTGAVYVQLIVGALMRHTGAGLAIPDFPLAFGRVVPPFESSAVVVHFAHRALGFVVFLAALATAMHALRHHRAQRPLLAPALLSLYLVMMQILLGGFTVWTQKAAVPTTLHVLNGALILATSLVLSLRSFRSFDARAHLARVEARVGEPVVT